MFARHDIIEATAFDDASMTDPAKGTTRAPIRMRVVGATDSIVALVILPETSSRGDLTLAEKKWPVVFTVSEAREHIARGLWTWHEGEYPVRPDDRDLANEIVERREQRWEAIRALVSGEVPAIFSKMERARLVARASEATGVSTHHIKRLLLRCFHRGMDEGAMLPDYVNCGAKGVERPGVPGRLKPGPARGDGKPGVAINAAIKSYFLNAYDAFKNNGKLDLHGAYRLCMRMYFSEIVDDLENGGQKRVPLKAFAETGLPTFEQFRYHVSSAAARREAAMKRLGRKYAMRKRALLSDSGQEAWGPGARYQIDATVLDAYIRSERDRGRLIPRPTLYVIIDVFSRMIVGFFISLEPPSWSTAMMALATVIEDKVELCARYGIEITPEQWPARGFGAILEGDKGEMVTANLEQVIRRFGATIENASSYRADWKGIVESRFRILQWGFKPHVDGYVDKDFRERGAEDYRKAARLTLKEMTRIIIRLILFHNNSNSIEGFRKHPGMMEDRVPAVPREIWNWGIANMSGTLRMFKEDLFRFALMPHAMATVTRAGIEHRDYHYTSPKAIDEGWFERAVDGQFKVPISFHPRDPAEILVHVPKAEGEYQVGRMTPSSLHQWHDMYHEEVAQLRAVDREVEAQHKEKELLGRMHTDDQIEAEMNAARDAFDECDTPDAIKRQVTGVRQNGLEEREQTVGELTREFSSKFEGSAAKAGQGEVDAGREQGKVVEMSSYRGSTTERRTGATPSDPQASGSAQPARTLADRLKEDR